MAGQSDLEAWGDLPEDVQGTFIEAWAGNPEAMFNLGVMNLKGEHLPKNETLAHTWFLKAARRGLARAQVNVAWMCADGVGVDKDIQQALTWYTRAAEQGDLKAQLALGQLYRWGQMGVETNQTEAAKWYGMAAKQKDRFAQMCLGMMYISGEGVEQDYRKAYDLLLESATQGDAEAQYNLSILYHHGNGVKRDLGASMLWLHTAAANGMAQAQYVLGREYEKGRPLKQNHPEATAWFRKAAEQGHLDAMDALRMRLYLDSEFGSDEEVESRYWKERLDEAKGRPPKRTVLEEEEEEEEDDLSELIETLLKDMGDDTLADSDEDEEEYEDLERWLDDEDARLDPEQEYPMSPEEVEEERITMSRASSLQAFFEEEFGSDTADGPDVEEPQHEEEEYSEEDLMCLRDEAESGDSMSQYLLGRCLALGQGVERDEALAARWFAKSAANLNPDASLALGLMYALGREVEQNYSEAHSYFSMAFLFGANDLGGLCCGVIEWMGLAENPDVPSAKKIIRNAAFSLPEARYLLGWLFDSGTAEFRSPGLARAHYERAASGGLPHAFIHLALLHEGRRGLPPNTALAYAHYLVAERLLRDGEGRAEMGPDSWALLLTPRISVSDRMHLLAHAFGPDFLPLKDDPQAVVERGIARCASHLTPEQAETARRAADRWRPGDELTGLGNA